MSRRLGAHELIDLWADPGSFESWDAAPDLGRLEMLHVDPRRPLTSMVFQEQSIFPWMTVQDNVAYGPRMRGVPDRESRDQVDYYIEKVGLGQFRRAYPHQLSGGMKQRVSVARAFANAPEILLMDEPFAALDAQNRLLQQREFIELWERTNATVVFVTHDLNEAILLSDRVAIMSHRPGRIVADVHVDLARPRRAEDLVADPAYDELYRRLYDALKDEVQAQLAEQERSV